MCSITALIFVELLESWLKSGKGIFDFYNEKSKI